MKLDIVSILYGLEPGGAEISTRLLVQDLAGYGVDVNVVSSRSQAKNEPHGIVLERLSRIPWQIILYGSNRVLDSVIRAAFIDHWSKRQPDVVLIEDHLAIVGAVEAVEVLRRRGQKIALALTQMWEVDSEFFYDFRPWLVAKLFVHRFNVANALAPKMDFVNGATPYMRGRLIDRLGVPPERCDVLHTVGLQEKPPPALVESDPPVLLAPGRINPEKGSLFFLDVVKRLAERRRDFKAVFLGGGPYEAAIRSEINKVKIDDVCSVTGKLPYEEFVRLYSSATAVVVPIMYPSAYTRVVLESLQSGKPVLTFDHGSMSDVVVNGVTGYRTAPRDVAAFAQACEKIIDDPRAALEMAPACYAIAAEYGDLKADSLKLIDRLRAAYERRYSIPLGAPVAETV